MSQVEIEAIALGRVLNEGRGSLPYSLIHGEALVAALECHRADAKQRTELVVGNLHRTG